MVSVGPAASPLEVASVEDVVYRRLRQEIGCLELAPGRRLRLEELAGRFGVSLTPVRQALRRLELAPGRRLRLEELAGRFGVSLTPVRQALRRLESEGLVVSLPRRGSRVAPLSVEELEEIQALRLGLETFLARAGAERCTDGALAEMGTARDEMERAFRAGDLDAYIRSFWSLRDACYRRAERPRLERALADQRIRVERYILHLCRDPEAFAALRRGPDTLLEACRARDGEAAEAATRDALVWVLAELRRMLDNVAPPAAEAAV